MGLPKKPEGFALKVDRREMGEADTLRYNVSSYVVEESYDRAIEALKSYMAREHEFPAFKAKAERYIAHAIDLVYAIQAKRNFPGANFLTMAKQQELNDRFRMHFNELQAVLRKIEKIHLDLKLDDIRSTVWVVKATVQAVFAILVIAFVLEVAHGLLQTAQVVVDDSFTKVTDTVLNKLGL